MFCKIDDGKILPLKTGSRPTFLKIGLIKDKKDACMQIWYRVQTVLGLGAYGPQK